MFGLLILSNFFWLVMGKSQITVVLAENESFTLPFIKHLNASFLYFKDYYSLSNEIFFNVAIINESATGADIVQKTQKTDYVISLLVNEQLQDTLRTVSLKVDMATIQIGLGHWDGIYLTTVDNETVSPNYAKFVPAMTVMDNILPDFFSKMNITDNVTILFDDFYEPDDWTWQDAFRRLTFSPNFVQMANPLDAAAVANQLKQLTRTATTLIFIAKTTDVENYVFNAIDFVNQFTWINYAKDTLPFKCEECIAVKMYTLRPLITNPTEDLRSLNDYLVAQELDVDMDYKMNSFDELRISACFDAMKVSFAYLIANNETLFGLISQSLQKPFQPLGENRTLFDVMRVPDLFAFEYGCYVHHFQTYFYQDAVIGIFDMDRQAALVDANINKYIGNWTFLYGIIPHYFNSLLVDVRRLSHYRIVTVIQEPFIIQSSDPGHPFEGYCIDLLNMIQQELHFTYEIYLVPDGKFGSVDDNGNWDGLIGQLVVGVADIALAPLSVMAERENDIDFTVPYYDLVGTTILMKKSDVEYSLFKFMKVLEWPVWLCIVGAYLFTSVLLWLFDRFSPYSYSNNREKFKDDPEKREFTLKECLWFCMTSLTPQGGGEAPKNVSGRLVAATWWLFGFIIIASYTANLAAFLTVSRLEQSIMSLDDLAKQYKIEYAPVKGGATETYFRRMAQIEELLYNIWKSMSLNESMSPLERAKLAVWDYPVSDKFTNMWRYMQESKMPNSISEAVDRVLTSDTGFAFIGDAMEIKYAILTNCQLQQVGTEFSRKPYAIAVQSGSALKDTLSAAILKFLNERKLEALKEKWWNDNPRKVNCPNMEDESNGISIQNIGGVFIVILAGIVLSFVTLIFEYFYYKRKRNRDAKAKQTKTTSTTEETAIAARGTGPLEAGGLHNGNASHYTNAAFQF